MEYIAHRINTLSELKELNTSYGVEIDLRDDTNGRIYISHDPFVKGEDFEEYLKHYNHGTMIANIKSERIEHKVKELLDKYGVKKYFFLDSSFPMIKLLSDMGEKSIAVRYSEFEGMETLKVMSGKVDWVWVDCFTYLPLSKEIELKIHKLGYKICIVSPELQKQPEKIIEYRDMLIDNDVKIDAVCSKIYNMDTWKNGKNKTSV